MTPLNDGVVTIYAVGNTAEPGDKPRKKLTREGPPAV